MRISRIITLFLLTFFSLLVLDVTGQSTFQASVAVNQNQITQCNSVNDNADLLNQLNATANCLTFSTNNIVLNCSNFRINGENDEGIGINITNRNNITIKNCLIANFSLGIFIQNGSDILFENVAIRDISEDDDDGDGDHDDDDTDKDIEINDSTNIFSFNSSILQSSGKNIDSYNFTNTSYNNMSYTFTNVTSVLFENVQSNSTTITAFNTTMTYVDSTFTNVTMTGSQNNITINKTSFINGTIEINNSGTDTHFEHSFFENANIIIHTETSLNMSNITMSNTTLTTNTTTLINVSFENNTNLISSHGIVRIVDSTIGLIDFTNTNFSITRENTSELNFITPLTGTTTNNLASLIIIKNNSIQVNSSAASFLNASARLLFYPQNFTDIEPKIDYGDNGTFVQCPASICENGTTTQTTFVFDVAHFTSFSFGGTQAAASTGAGKASTGEKSRGAAAPIIRAPEISPASIDAVMKPGDIQEFVVTINAGSKPLDLDVILHAPSFITLNDETQRYSISLPKDGTWRAVITITLPDDAQGKHEATLILKNKDLEHTIPITITVPAFFTVQPTQEEPAPVIAEKKTPSLLARQPRLRKLLSYVPLATIDTATLQHYSTALRTWTILLGIIMVVFIVTLIAITEPHALRELSKILHIKKNTARIHKETAEIIKEIKKEAHTLFTEHKKKRQHAHHIHKHPHK